MALGKKGIRRIILYVTAFILAAVLLLPFAVHPLLNSDTIKTRLAREIQARSGLTLAPDQFFLVLAPFPGIRFQNLNLEPAPGIQVSLDTAGVEFDTLQLLDLKLVVDRIWVQGAHVRTPGANAKAPNVKGTAIPDLRLPSAPVDLLFSFLDKNQKTLALDITGLASDYFQTMDAHVLAFRENKKILVQTLFQGLLLTRENLPSLLGPLPFTQVRAQTVSATLNLDNGNSLNGKLTVTAPDVLSPAVTKGPMAAEALSVEFSLSPETVSARLLPATLSYPSATVGVDFDQDPASGKTAVTFSGQTVNIDQAREVCLPLLAGFHVSDQLFDILRAGTAQTITVAFKGDTPDTLFDGGTMVLSGQAADARVNIPATPLTAQGVWANVTMDKGVLHIEPSQGQVGTTRLKGGVLDIDLVQDHEVPFTGRFPLDVRLDELPETLILLLPGTRLARELARVSKISGTARAELGLSMPPGARELSVTVNADQIQANGTYERIPLPLTIDQGTFLFGSDEVQLKNFSGSLGNSPVRELTATVRVTGDNPMTVRSASGTFVLDEVMPWAKTVPGVMALLAPARQASGTLILNRLAISGPMFVPEKWEFSAAGTGQNLSIGFKGHPKALTEVSGRYDISHDHVSVSDIKARAEGIGWLDFALAPEVLSSIRVPLDVFESRMDKKAGQIFIHGKMTSPSGPMATFDLAGKDLGHLFPTLITLKDPGLSDALVIPYREEDQPLMSFEGQLHTRTLQKILVIGSRLQQTLDTLTAGQPLSIATDANADLVLETGKINLDILLDTPKEEKEKPAPKKSRPLLAQKSLFFNAGELVYLKRTFTDVESHLTFDPSSTHVDILKAGLCGLKGHGRVDILHNGPRPEAATTFAVEAGDDKTLADVMSCLFKSESLITGAYTFSMNIAGKGPSNKVSGMQDGVLTFKAQDGRIYKATILSRVLSVINILDADLSQKGFAYKTFTVEADVQDSVIHVKKAYIDAENMAVIASGWLDPLNDQMDVTFLVAPFKTIDSLIKRIPVVNTLLSGRLVSLPARASGRISDPLVVPLSPKAVGKGLINMFKDLIKTPVRLFESDDDQ